MSRTRRTNFFFWGWHIRTGFKYVNIDFTDTNEDLALRGHLVDSRFREHLRLSLRPTPAARLLHLYRGLRRLRPDPFKVEQTDAYISPATLGFETILGRNWNFFVELRVIISLNGWETSRGVISDDGRLSSPSDSWALPIAGVAFGRRSPRTGATRHHHLCGELTIQAGTPPTPDSRCLYNSRGGRTSFPRRSRSWCIGS